MVRPEFDVVIERLQIEELVFRLDVTVLGDADIDADGRFIDVGPVEAGIGDGFAGAIDPQAAGPGAAAELFFPLVAELVEIADPGDGRSDVAGFVGTDGAAAGQQIGTEIAQIVGPWRGQAHPGDHNPLSIGARDHKLQWGRWLNFSSY